MKKICLAITLCAIAVAGCAGLVVTRTKGSGNRAVEDRQLDKFDGVSVRGSLRVHVAESSTPSCKVIADDNIVPLVRTEVVGGILNIFTDEPYDSVIPVEVSVAAPGLTKLELDGSGSLDATGITVRSLSTTLEGSGEVRLQGSTVESLVLSLTGSGSLTAKGSAKHMNLNLAGSGNANLSRLCVSNGSVSLTGSGDAAVSVSNALHVNLTGSGDVSCAGEPSLEVSKDVSGSGTVRMVGSGSCVEPRSNPGPEPSKPRDAGV